VKVAYAQLQKYVSEESYPGVASGAAMRLPTSRGVCANTSGSR
jgi:hypothetical protein